MRIAVVVNIRSGRGRAVAASRRLEAQLEHHGVEVCQVVLPSAAADLDRTLSGCSAAVVVGGDGTVRSLLPALLKRQVALGILPTGTENLAARALGFVGPVERLVAALLGGRRRQVDVGRVNLQPFLVMASIGFDADLVRRVDEGRRGPIRRSAYIWAALGMVPRWRPVPMRVWVDGRPLFDGLGQLVVANCREYAARLDPVRTASPFDGKLSAAVLPTPSLAGVARWALTLSRKSWNGEGAITADCRVVEVECADRSAVQVDGDPLGPQGVTHARFEVVADGLSLVDMRRGQAQPEEAGSEDSAGSPDTPGGSPEE